MNKSSSSVICALENVVRGFFLFGAALLWYGCPMRRSARGEWSKEIIWIGVITCKIRAKSVNYYKDNKNCNLDVRFVIKLFIFLRKPSLGEQQRSVSRCLGRSFGKLVARSVNRLVGQLLDRSLSWPEKPKTNTEAASEAEVRSAQYEGCLYFEPNFLSVSFYYLKKLEASFKVSNYSATVAFCSFQMFGFVWEFY